ncbi:hypothetical protein H8E77_31525 [bacterium]|nr:hypothetical protein [bacterium]
MLEGQVNKDLKCPGSKSVREPVPEVFTCPNCGAEVEIWTHEHMRICNSCGKTVVREIDTVWCIQWCPYAKDCIGVEKYEELLEAGAISEERKEEISIPQKLKEFMREGNIPIPGEEN